ncbi:uncharacterized protein LOC110852334 [Folsomia candida]|uniref:uncharacterized protein LOC110852334 n=1 Tax=Folsomia candida TaxID=158441 RepID=UPI000B8F271E|nr:uncharacterized protein LOC110852334 [Folsomia candida]
MTDTASFPFVRVEDPSVLIPVLEKRLPKSALVYNSAKMYGRVFDKSQVSFYTLYGDVDETSWIIYLHFREDYGQDYLISADEEKSKISRDEATGILSSCSLFKWDEPFFFAAVEKWISSIILDISVSIKGNITMIHPTYMFYKDIEECLTLDVSINDHTKNVQVQRLDPELGLKFILDTWKYATKDSDIVVRRAIELNKSGGVYVDGKPVCGVITQGFGILSALYTLQEHRKKGYANACMNFAYKELAKEGLIPTSTVEIRNEASIAFHKKLGCKIGYKADYIFFMNDEF